MSREKRINDPRGEHGDEGKSHAAPGETVVTRSVLVWVLFKSVLRFVASLFGGSPLAEARTQQNRPTSGRVDDLICRHSRHEALVTLFAVCSFTIALAAGVLFLINYWAYDKVDWSAGNNFVLGGTLALFLGGLGFGSVLYGRSLIVQKRAIEPREVLPSTAEEREATREAYVAGKHDVGRRALLVAAGLSSAGIFGAMVVSLMRSLATPPDPTIFDTVWKQGQLLVTSDARPISADFLNAGDTVVVFPEGKIGSEHAQTVLIRVDERSLQLPPERANWAPKGYIAYSRVCTHAGCPVGMFERTTNLLLCPCHQSTFDVLRGAKPTAGPAARPLPQLPLYIDDAGVLRAGGGFSEPPGPGFWGLA